MEQVSHQVRLLTHSVARLPGVSGSDVADGDEVEPSIVFGLVDQRLRILDVR
jgi:hypothetical protein